MEWIPQFLWVQTGSGSPFSDVDPLRIPTGSPPGSLSFGHHNVLVRVHVSQEALERRLPRQSSQPKSLFTSWVGLVGASQCSTVSSHRTGLLWLGEGWVPTHTCMLFLLTTPLRVVCVYVQPHISAASVLPLSLPGASSSWGNLGTAPLHHTPPKQQP